MTNLLCEGFLTPVLTTVLYMLLQPPGLYATSAMML